MEYSFYPMYRITIWWIWHFRNNLTLEDNQ